MGDDTVAGGEEGVQIRFNQFAELLVDRHHRQACIARLLQTFEQQGAIALRLEQMCVEVVAFDLLRIGQNDLSDTQRRQLSPESSHDFWSRQRQEEVHGRSLRRVAVECALQRDPSVVDRRDSAHTKWAVDEADADLLVPLHLQHGDEVACLHAGGVDRGIGADVVGVEEDEIHRLQAEHRQPEGARCEPERGIMCGERDWALHAVAPDKGGRKVQRIKRTERRGQWFTPLPERSRTEVSTYSVTAAPDLQGAVRDC